MYLKNESSSKENIVFIISLYMFYAIDTYL